MDHTRRHCPVTPPVCHRCGDPGHATDKCHWPDEHVIADCANREGGAGRCPAFVPLPQINLGPPPIGNHRAQANRAQYEAGWHLSPPPHPDAGTTAPGPSQPPPANTDQSPQAPSSVAVVTCPANASPESRALYTVLSQTQQAQNNLLAFASSRMDASDRAIASLQTTATEASAQSGQMLSMLQDMRSMMQGAMTPTAGTPQPGAYVPSGRPPHPGAGAYGSGATPPQ